MKQVSCLNFVLYYPYPLVLMIFCFLISSFLCVVFCLCRLVLWNMEDFRMLENFVFQFLIARLIKYENRREKIFIEIICWKDVL